MKKTDHSKEKENPLYHDTLMLLKKYRDVVWSLELSVQQVRRQFKMEYGSSIEDFLDSIYLAGVDFSDAGIEEHAKSIERSYKMLKLMETAVNLLRSKHKFGEAYYWILYYSFLSPQQYGNTEEIIEQLRPHIRDISYRTYFRKRKEAIDAFSAILWGYSSRTAWIFWKFFSRKIKKADNWHNIGMVLRLSRKKQCDNMYMLKNYREQKQISTSA